VWFASYEYCKVELLLMANNMSSYDQGRAEHGDKTDEFSSSSVSYYESVAVPLVSGAFAATTAWVSRVVSSRVV
jgi:hypothetical protein